MDDENWIWGGSVALCRCFCHYYVARGRLMYEWGHNVGLLLRFLHAHVSFFGMQAAGFDLQ